MQTVTGVCFVGQGDDKPGGPSRRCLASWWEWTHEHDPDTAQPVQTAVGLAPNSWFRAESPTR
jgi:hypothetical protein